jgi:hypothetical protein
MSDADLYCLKLNEFFRVTGKEGRKKGLGGGGGQVAQKPSLHLCYHWSMILGLGKGVGAWEACTCLAV